MKQALAQYTAEMRSERENARAFEKLAQSFVPGTRRFQEDRWNPELATTVASDERKRVARMTPDYSFLAGQDADKANAAIDSRNYESYSSPTVDDYTMFTTYLDGMRSGVKPVEGSDGRKTYTRMNHDDYASLNNALRIIMRKHANSENKDVFNLMAGMYTGGDLNGTINRSVVDDAVKGIRASADFGRSSGTFGVNGSGDKLFSDALRKERETAGATEQAGNYTIPKRLANSLGSTAAGIMNLGTGLTSSYMKLNAQHGVPMAGEIAGQLDKANDLYRNYWSHIDGSSPEVNRFAAAAEVGQLPYVHDTNNMVADGRGGQVSAASTSPIADGPWYSNPATNVASSLLMTAPGFVSQMMLGAPMGARAMGTASAYARPATKLLSQYMPRTGAYLGKRLPQAARSYGGWTGMGTLMQAAGGSENPVSESAGDWFNIAAGAAPFAMAPGVKKWFGRAKSQPVTSNPRSWAGLQQVAEKPTK